MPNSHVRSNMVKNLSWAWLCVDSKLLPHFMTVWHHKASRLITEILVDSKDFLSEAKNFSTCPHMVQAVPMDCQHCLIRGLK